MFLKRYMRGSVLMLSTLAALSVVVTEAVNQALTIIDRINSGEIPPEAEAIIELTSVLANGTENSTLSIVVTQMCKGQFAIWIVKRP